MQGCLRNEKVAVSLETSCAHCGAALHIDVDSEDRWKVHESNAEPLLFSPAVDWETFKKPHIIDDF